MTKIRTVTQLIDETDMDLSWRRQELSQLRQISFRNKNSKSVKRSLIVLIYAYWEGFIKNSASKYVEYVAMQRLQNQELAPNFLTLSLYSRLNQISQSKKFEDRLEIVEFFKSELENRNQSLNDSVINTRSNLSFEVFKNIVFQLGLDISQFETKQFFIDNQIELEYLIDHKLVKRRNQIAHGEFLTESLEDIYDLVDIIIDLMDTFKTQIQNAAIQGSYKI